MTISSSLNAGVAGLNANAVRLATISDNIANASTYGYKRSTVEFQSFVLNNGSSSTYSAGGVQARTQRIIDQQGPLVTSSHPLDIAISGRGMLPVTTISSVENGATDTPMMMTSTGSFRTDANGILRTEGGLVLLGWPADADGTIPTFARDTKNDLEPVVLNFNQTSGDPTTEITLGVNLPATETYAGGSGDALPLTVEYYGNLGTSEALNISFTPTIPATGSSNEWTMVITDTASAGAVIGEYTLTFDNSRANGGTLQNVTVVSGGAYDGLTGTLSLNVAGGPMSVTIGQLGDPNGLTQLSDSFAPTSLIKDGSPVGNLTAVEITENGLLQASYDTGFTRTLYQIPVVDVPNANGLIALGDQAYQVSPQSGSFFLWDGGDGPTGEISGYSRELSTTDVAGELTNLIQTQRAYSSNAKVIQTVDEMLQETTNIKR
ncbi:flagellar hook-basal body complex protein [Rhodobacterales bacterium HKCCE2091]|nr:flagellar hook-basal body complex protein [Rhodobacterales bacterium HKCCE2091]